MPCTASLNQGAKNLLGGGGGCPTQYDIFFEVKEFCWGRNPTIYENEFQMMRVE